ncbi:MAG: hypothetical protein OHK0019_31990 [Saprospiraceae bacterium]
MATRSKVTRSKEIWIVALYLSKFSQPAVKGKKRTVPPIQLGVEKWKDAYRMFYESLGKDRSIVAFERSLKNARDAYDYHVQNSKRIGWRSKLGDAASSVFEKYEGKTQGDIWNEIREWANDELKSKR